MRRKRAGVTNPGGHVVRGPSGRSFLLTHDRDPSRTRVVGPDGVTLEGWHVRPARADCALCHRPTRMVNPAGTPSHPDCELVAALDALDALTVPLPEPLEVPR